MRYLNNAYARRRKMTKTEKYGRFIMYTNYFFTPVVRLA